MRVKFWGVRGSLPSPPPSDAISARLSEALFRLGQEKASLDLSDRDAIERWVDELPHSVRSFTGGNTPCVELQIGDELFIIDFGSGLRALGDHLMNREFGQGRGHAHLFLSHLHWDHIQGWPFFKPAYVPGNRFDLYARQDCAWERLRDQQTAPFFPPEAWGDMSAETRFHHLPSEPVLIGNGIRVSTLELEHPSLAYGFRLEANGRVFVYASDSAYPSPDASGPKDPAQKFVDFFEGADLVIFDAQFSLAESRAKRAWGHSSAIIGVELAAKAGVKRLAMFHHDPSASDIYLEDQLRVSRAHAAEANAPTNLSKVDVLLAREGLEIEL